MTQHQRNTLTHALRPLSPEEITRQVLIADPVEFVEEMAELHPPFAPMVSDCRRWRAEAEAKGGRLAVLVWSNGLHCFVEWQGGPACLGVLELTDEHLRTAHRHAMSHEGSGPPLLRLTFQPAPAPVTH